MQFGEIELPTYPAEAFTRDYHVQGCFQPIGPMLTHLNDAGRYYVHFADATVSPLDSANPLNRVQRPTVMVRRSDIIYISLLDQSGVEAAHLLVNKHRLVVYTPLFAIQASFHMGADDVPMDLLNSSVHHFLGATDATLFALRPLAGGLRRTARLLLINREQVHYYHALD